MALSVDLSQLPGVARELDLLAQDASTTAHTLADFAARYPHPAGQPGDEIANEFEKQFRKPFNDAVAFLERLAAGLKGDGDGTVLTRDSLHNSDDVGIDTVHQFRKG